MLIAEKPLGGIMALCSGAHRCRLQSTDVTAIVVIGAVVMWLEKGRLDPTDRKGKSTELSTS